MPLGHAMNDGAQHPQDEREGHERITGQVDHDERWD